MWLLGGGSIVTKDIPDNCIAAGVPAKVIGNFDSLVEKRRKVIWYDNPEAYWETFENMRK